MGNITGYTKAQMDTSLALLAPLASPALTGNPTAPTPTTGDNDTSIATTAFVQGEKLPIINAQTDAYSLVLTDARKYVEISNASGVALTVPLNSAVAFPIGTEINVLQTGAGKITVSPTGGVTVNSPGALLGTRAQWSSIKLRKRDTDLWVLSGDVG